VLKSGGGKKKGENKGKKVKITYNKSQITKNLQRD
jgi:hypothetical protein